MSLLYLVTEISLATTAALVGNGYAFGPSAAITGATNTTPIVITTAAPMGIPEGSYIHVVTSSIGGNVAANGTYIAKVLTNGPSSSTLSLFSSTPSGPSAVAGTGSYTSGGTLRTAFSDGRILLGPQWLMAHSAPPRIVFVPFNSEFDQKPTPSAGVNPNGSKETQLSRPWTWTDLRKFKVEVWAAQYLSGQLASDPDLDWMYLEATRDALIQSISLLMLGAFRMSGGKWSESDPRNANLDIAGRRFEFAVDMFIPVLLQPNPVPFVPDGTNVTATVFPSTASATGPDAITIVTP